MAYSKISEKKFNINMNAYYAFWGGAIYESTTRLADKLAEIGEKMCYGRGAALTIVPGIILRDSATAVREKMNPYYHHGFHYQNRINNRVGDGRKFLSLVSSAAVGGMTGMLLGGAATLAALVAPVSIAAFALTAAVATATSVAAYVAGRASYAPLEKTYGVLGAALFTGIPAVVKAIPVALINIGTGRLRAQEAREEAKVAEAVASGKDIKLIEGEKNAAMALQIIQSLPEPTRVTFFTDLSKQFAASLEKSQAEVVTVRVKIGCKPSDNITL